MRSGFYNSEIIGYDIEGVPIFDRAEDAEFFARFFKSFFTNGVYPNPGTNFQVLKGTGLNVLVQPGMCFIEGHFAWESEIRELSLQAAETLDRIDRVVLRLNNLTRAIDLYVLKGIASKVPMAPALTRTVVDEIAGIYEMALADIVVSRSETSLSQAHITDQRLNSKVCGLVVEMIKEIDTSVYHEQMIAMVKKNDDDFKAWLESVMETMSEGIMAKSIYDKNDDGIVDKTRETISNEIVGRNDLNLVIQNGHYHSLGINENTLITNCPTTHPFSIVVFDKPFPMQHLTSSNQEVFIRTKEKDSWSNWVILYSTKNPPVNASTIKDGLMSKEDKGIVEEVNTLKHSHSNKSALDSISEASLATWDTVNTKANTEDVLIKNNEVEFIPTTNYAPATKKYVDDRVIAAGSGDMLKSVYDPDDEGIIAKARADASGNNIKDAYASSLTVSGRTLTLKNKNGANLSQVTTQDTTYGLVSTGANGLMSATNLTTLNSHTSQLGGSTLKVLTQAEYNAIGTKSASTIYFIKA